MQQCTAQRLCRAAACCDAAVRQLSSALLSNKHAFYKLYFELVWGVFFLFSQPGMIHDRVLFGVNKIKDFRNMI